MKYLKIIVPFLVFFLFLMAFEFGSFIYLSSINEEVSSTDECAESEMWQNSTGKESYTELDPLLGWSISAEKSTVNNYTEIANSFVFNTKNLTCEDTLKVYISGGSTSDVVFDNENWPISLIQILDQRGICAQVYVAAVAGYSTGQELLKLIRDINQIQPDFHISYSGVNEADNPSYVTDYEVKNYELLLASPSVLPNSITLLKKIILKKPSYDINYPSKNNAVSFWEQNMKNMHALAQSNDYRFIGVLQPVFKFEDHLSNHENDILYSFAHEYVDFYPEARKLSLKHEYIYDYSRYFDNHAAGVFKDDCHLSGVSYQNEIAEEIFTLFPSFEIFSEKNTIGIDH